MLFLLNIALVVDVDDDSIGGGTTVGVVHGGITVVCDAVVVVVVLFMVVLLWLMMQWLWCLCWYCSKWYYCG